jgi:hypothetical protein
MNIHTFKDNIDIIESFAALSRAVNTYNSAGVDLVKYRGEVCFAISAGNFGGGATLDAKLQESDDPTFAQGTTDLVGGALGVKNAAGYWMLTARVRQFRKRYARIQLTVGVAAVVCAVILTALPNEK